MKNKYAEIAESYGWEQIVSKNKYMYSFLKDDVRLNIYFTTGTVTFQDLDRNLEKHIGILTDEELEKILIKRQENDEA
jgi:hypothetical protein